MANRIGIRILVPVLLLAFVGCVFSHTTVTPAPTESVTPAPTESITPAPTESITPEPTAEPAAALAGKTFVRENGGFGGDFTITLGEDGTFTYYEGFLSSYIGIGAWSLSDGVLTLRENSDYGFVFRFAVTDGALCYLAEGSDRFLYVDVADGERFLPDD